MQRCAEQSQKKMKQFSAFPRRLGVFASKFVSFQTTSYIRRSVTKSKNKASPTSGTPRIATPPTIMSRSGATGADWVGGVAATDAVSPRGAATKATGAAVGVAGVIVSVGNGVANAGVGGGASGIDIVTAADMMTAADAGDGAIAGGNVSAGGDGCGRTMMVIAVETAPPILAAASR